MSDQNHAITKKTGSPVGTKGYTGNPGGRPKLPDAFKTQLRGVTQDIIEYWIDTFKDEEVPHQFRMKASENLFDRAYGKPAQSLSVEDDESDTAIPTVTVTFVKAENHASR